MSLNDPTVCDVDVACGADCGEQVRIHDLTDAGHALCPGCETAVLEEALDRADGHDAPELHAARQRLAEAAL